MPLSEAEITRLHTAYAEASLRLAWSITKDQSLAQDVVQEVFIKLTRHGLVSPDSEVERTWLFTITGNTALDALRREQRRAGRDERWSAEIPLWFEPQDTAGHEELISALAALPEEQRTAIHLHLWEGQSFREIAKTLDLPTQTIASRYRYGLAKIRASLAQTSPQP
jgi:RNA polymerase sigma-70 factor, ECF subfamily